MTGQEGMNNLLNAVHEIGELLMCDAISDNKFDYVIDVIHRSSGCDAANLCLVNGAGELLQVTAVPCEAACICAGDGYLLWLKNQLKPGILPPHISPDKNNFITVLSAPIVLKGSLLGAINLGYDNQISDVDSILIFLGIVTQQMVRVLESMNSESFEHTQTALSAGTDSFGAVTGISECNELIKFAMSLNHEINNPLTSIIGNADLILLSEDQINEDFRAKLEIIITEAKRITLLIAKLGDLKKTVLDTARSNDRPKHAKL